MQFLNNGHSAIERNPIRNQRPDYPVVDADRLIARNWRFFHCGTRNALAEGRQPFAGRRARTDQLDENLGGKCMECRNLGKRKITRRSFKRGCCEIRKRLDYRPPQDGARSVWKPHLDDRRVRQPSQEQRYPYRRIGQTERHDGKRKIGAGVLEIAGDGRQPLVPVQFSPIDAPRTHRTHCAVSRSGSGIIRPAPAWRPVTPMRQNRTRGFRTTRSRSNVDPPARRGMQPTP